MATREHEIWSDLFRQEPSLAGRLLEPLGVSCSREHIRVVDTTFPATEDRANLVILLGPKSHPELAVIVEAQPNEDEAKLFLWPLYAAFARLYYRCPTCVLVFTTHSRVAHWARRPIFAGPSWSFRAMVIGKEQVPAVHTLEEAEVSPALTVLSALSHARGAGGVAAVLAALPILARFKADRPDIYYDLLLQSLRAADREKMETQMRFPENYEFSSSAYLKQFERDSAKLLLQKVREDIATVLRARSIEISKASSTLLADCAEVAQLQKWLEKAAIANFEHEVFELPAKVE